MLKTLQVSQLKPGMMVDSVVSQHGPVKIRKVGMIRSPEMIKGLTEMGVTEVEIDLDQSIGVDVYFDGDNEELNEKQNHNSNRKVITPTQQLLKNEREVAKATSAIEQQYHRSLFMPSSEALPNMWQLYGKKSGLLALLVIGGLSFGWNLAHIGEWVSLMQSPSYERVEYIVAQPSPTQINKFAGSSADTQEKQSNVKGEPANNQVANNEQVSTPEQSTTKEASAAPIEEELPPLVLGYQGNGDIDLEALENAAEQAPVVNTTNASTLDGVSADLLNKVNQAAAAIDGASSDSSTGRESDFSVPSANTANRAGADLSTGSNSEPDLPSNYKDLPRIDQLSIAIQTEIPSMTYSAHLYSSEPEDRWVRLNGRRLREGDYIAEGLQLVNIEPQTVILSFKDEVFTMNAMSDW